MQCRPALAGLILALLAALTISCSFDYSDSELDGDPMAELPSVEILDVRMVIVRDNRIELVADRIATYDERGVREFRELRFTEFGPDGSVRLEGEATTGVLTIDTENIELRGTVRFYSAVEDASLESTFLSWQSADRVLTGLPDDLVTVRQSDGSRIEGRGLRLDGRRNQLEFSAGVEGVYESNGEGE